jgi:hypothetical protein
MDETMAPEMEETIVDEAVAEEVTATEDVA